MRPSVISLIFLRNWTSCDFFYQIFTSSFKALFLSYFPIPQRRAISIMFHILYSDVQILKSCVNFEVNVHYTIIPIKTNLLLRILQKHNDSFFYLSLVYLSVTAKDFILHLCFSNIFFIIKFKKLSFYH